MSGDAPAATISIDPSMLSTAEAYRLATGVVVPRPIAWITTLSESGVVNLAPFSFFTILSHEPIMVGISISRRGEVLKDTAANMMREREFVVNLVHESQSAAVHESSRMLPPDVSEAELLGLRTVPSQVVRVPRLATAPVALECRWDRRMPTGRGESELHIGEVQLVQVSEQLWRDGRIDTEQLRPLARVAGPNYAELGAMKRYSAQFQRL
jgi:flavin reductase (DIM6/NTAB) family NADH-FMN oxidoreductase RutF